MNSYPYDRATILYLLHPSSKLRRLISKGEDANPVSLIACPNRSSFKQLVGFGGKRILLSKLFKRIHLSKLFDPIIDIDLLL
jgi:hypothetical protein